MAKKTKKEQEIDNKLTDALDYLLDAGLIRFELDDNGEKLYYPTAAGKRYTELLDLGVSPKN